MVSQQPFVSATVTQTKKKGLWDRPIKRDTEKGMRARVGAEGIGAEAGFPFYTKLNCYLLGPWDLSELHNTAVRLKQDQSGLSLGGLLLPQDFLSELPTVEAASQTFRQGE